MMKNHSAAIMLLLCIGLVSKAQSHCDISLNGQWECGFDRQYTESVAVPGLAADPSRVENKSLWYKTSVKLPQGSWNKSELELKGARFRPKVYVDGILVSSKEGGMAATVHNLPGLVPGGTAQIEVELAPLSQVPPEDASRIPEVDQWRSNVSSCLWDDVVLHLYEDARVDRVLTSCDSKRKVASLKYRVKGKGASRASICISDSDKPVFEKSFPVSEGENMASISYKGLLSEWSPASPTLYTVCVTLYGGDGHELSSYGQTLCLRDFYASRKQFVLNGKKIRARGGSVVWHRWMRDKEAAEIGFDSDWFVKNVITPMKERGANYLRFHLGVPPERILDACDRHGMMVQYEWSFFHGMPASYGSLIEQYSSWLDRASRHPSVVIFHPYNETEPEELVRVNMALDSLQKIYPPMVMEDRQVINIHRYWWGMSENLGLYYDSYKQFVLPVMVDEFGGVYLDGDYNVGGYPMLRPAMKRWLGPRHTAMQRSEQQQLAYGKVGEYWRRIGVAGVAAFPIICSFEDGNHWYEGPIKEGRLKPVWNSMTPVWAEKTVSMDIWNRNYLPGQTVRVPVHFINDSDSKAEMLCELVLGDYRRVESCRVPAHCKRIKKVKLRMPDVCGRYKICAQLLNGSEDVSHPIESCWDVNVLEVAVPNALEKSKIYIPKREKELHKMAGSCGLDIVSKIGEAKVALYGKASWERISEYTAEITEAIENGVSVVLLDVGDSNLGKSYDDGQRNLGNMSGAPKISSARIITTPLVSGLSLTTVQVAEGESHIHPSPADSSLWNGLTVNCTRLWNGLRGGIIVPAAGMEVSGLSQEAFLNLWTARGADEAQIIEGPYFAYEYCGFYAYDSKDNSAEAEKYLRDKVAFLVEDMPALALSLPRNTPIRVTDLHSSYVSNEGVKVSGLTAMAVAGKDLVRTPVMKVEFGENDGSLILSQLITQGRLAPGYAPWRRVRPLEFDPAAVTFVLNMIDNSLK